MMRTFDALTEVLLLVWNETLLWDEIILKLLYECGMIANIYNYIYILILI